MIDLHCHIIPYIDDGARSAHIACAMARHAVQSGVTTIVATPHCNLGRRPNYRDREYYMILGMFRALLKQEGIDLTVLPGSEVFVRPSNIRALIEENRLVTLNHSRYLLVEFPFDCSGRVISQLLDAIARRGLVPVVAHPERYDAVQDSPQLVARWFSQGYIIQVNKGSLLGRLGSGADLCSNHLLRHGLVHVIAGDAHDMKYRPTGFRSLISAFEPKIGSEYLRLLLHTNPQRIISDLPIPSPNTSFSKEEFR